VLEEVLLGLEVVEAVDWSIVEDVDVRD